MKLLGWMHRKFRQNSGEPYRDLNTGYPCNCLSGRPSLEESQLTYYGHQKPSRFPPRASHDRFFFPEEVAGGLLGGPDDEEHPPAMDELFQGLLAIGTLGSLGKVNEEDPAAGDATPTFGVSALPLIYVDAIAEKEEGYEATEDDLMIINAELEKVLLAPEGDKSDRLSSARASQVSAKQLVLSSCPLQEYLFGSLVDMAETTAVAATQEKKEHHRTSLGELFMRSRMVEGGNGISKKEDRDKPTAGMHLMVKKLLKRRGSGGFSRSSTCHDPALEGDESSGYSVNPETKLQKIMQIFHRKVHPENSIAAKKAAKPAKCWNKTADGGRGNTGFSRKSVSVAGVMRKEGDQQGARKSEVASADIAATVGGGCGDSSGNREQWIKTDAEYLVLEL